LPTSKLALIDKDSIRAFIFFRGRFAGLARRVPSSPVLAVCQPKLAVKKSLKNLNMGEEGTYEKRIN